MSKQYINETTGSIWWKAANRGHSICHFGSLDPRQQVSTGQQYLTTYTTEDSLRQVVNTYKGEGYYDSIVSPPTGSEDSGSMYIDNPE